MDMIIATIPGHVRDYLTQWIGEYDTAVARDRATDPEGHEQALMETSRLLGTASALLRLIEGSTADYTAGYAVNGYPAAADPYPRIPQHAGPAPDADESGFRPFAGQEGYRP